ncbi:MAG: 16S rRNA processing protein RimM [Candidatus Hydrogenedentota bacterium]|nr:MAG: 16S rRNA processing protein RimM [Candidatus Hydrogenedentota bacterium]
MIRPIWAASSERTAGSSRPSGRWSRRSRPAAAERPSNSKSSTDPNRPGTDPDRRDRESALVHLARIGRPRGVKGEVILHLLTDRPEEVLGTPGEYLLLDGRTIPVKKLGMVAKKWIWRLDVPPEVSPRDFAARFTNAVVVAPPETLPPLDDDTFSEFELSSFQVLDTTGRILGRFLRLERHYEIDTWVIETEDGREFDIPAVKEFIPDVDRKRRIIVIDPKALHYS